MAMKRFSKLRMSKMGKRPMMMALTALVIIFLFWFFFMRRREGFREGNAASAFQEDVKKYNNMDSAAKAAYDKKHPNQASKIKAENEKTAAAKAAKAAPAKAAPAKAAPAPAAKAAPKK